MKFPFELPSRYRPTPAWFQGGRGIVYICEDTYLDRKVAIKLVKSKLHTHELRKEIRALTDIRSKHVAEIYDVVESKGGSLGLVQEYVPGVDLDQYARSGERNGRDFLMSVLQIARGLADIHIQRIVHRDIKPSNLKFDGEKVLKILDFGFMSEIVAEGETTDARGTLGYRAPELHGSGPLKFTHKADIYALGATAWSLRNKGRLHQSLIVVPPQRAGKPPSFSTWPDIPGPVASILDDCLSVDPSGRPAAREVSEVVQRNILFGQHRATFTLPSGPIVLAQPRQSVRVGGNEAQIVVSYDGLYFVITHVQGDAYVNNQPVMPGMRLPNSCVLTLGGRHLRSDRTFVPVDVSHPEVII